MNLRTVRLDGGAVSLGGTSLALTPQLRSTAGSEVVIGVRPESVAVVTPDTAGAMALEVTLVEQLGADSYIHGSLAGEADGSEKPFIVRADGRYEARRGETVSVALRGPVEHVFHAASGARIG
jgi:multiple sugar transport system ATP-binding protein